MTKFAIRIDPRSFKKTVSGALVGRVFVELAGKSFPDQNWSDFLVILAYWLPAVRSLQSARVKSASLGFMEGPYQIQILKTADQKLVLTPSDRRGRNVDVAPVSSVNLDYIADEILVATRLVVEACRQKQIHSSDVNELAKVLGPAKGVRLGIPDSSDT